MLCFDIRQVERKILGLAHLKTCARFVVFGVNALPKPGELAAVQLKLADQLALAGFVYSDLFPKASST